jgi:hypothetical protein
MTEWPLSTKPGSFLQARNQHWGERRYRGNPTSQSSVGSSRDISGEKRSYGYRQQYPTPPANDTLGIDNLVTKMQATDNAHR